MFWVFLDSSRYLNFDIQNNFDGSCDVILDEQVRAGSLQELVYKQGQAGVTRATVTVVFNNKDKNQSPVGYEAYDEIAVCRQVTTIFESCDPTLTSFGRLLLVAAISI